LIRSPAYIAQYRALARGDPASSRSGPSQQVDDSGSSTAASSLSDKTYRSTSKLSFKSFTWSRSDESRRRVEHLCQAAKSGNVKWIENLVKDGAYIDGWIVEEAIRHTPLMCAVMARKRDAVNTLLGLGANVEAKDSDGHTVWYYAARESDDLLRLLLKRARIGDVNHVFERKSEFADKRYDGLLWVAIEKNNLDTVRLLVDSGVKVDGTLPSYTIKRPGLVGAKVDGTLSPSHCTTRVELVLAGRGSDSRPTPLFAASCRVECLEILEYLVTKGASLTSTTNCLVQDFALGSQRTRTSSRRKNITPLHLARGACAALLAEKGANVFAVDDRGRTPLFWAIEWPSHFYDPDLAAVVANLAQGSPVNLQDMSRQTPLTRLAARIRRYEWMSIKSICMCLDVAKALRDAGATHGTKYGGGIGGSLTSRQIFSDLDKKRGGVIKSRGVAGCLRDREGNSLWGLCITEGLTCDELNGRLIELRADDGTMEEGNVMTVDPDDDSDVQRYLLTADRAEQTGALVDAFVELCDVILVVVDLDEE